MNIDSPLTQVTSNENSTIEVGGARLVSTYSDSGAEWAAVDNGTTLFDCADRALIRIRGGDRATWLHNLVTNAVTKVEPGLGNYSFACDVQGRIQFDLTFFVTDDAILVDLQRDLVPVALAHFDRFLITEDVQIADLSNEYVRIDCLGKNSEEIAKKLGFAGVVAMTDLSHVQIAEADVRLVRILHRGLNGFSIYLPINAACDRWQQMIASGATACGYETREMVRIRAGLPRFGQDFSTRSLPAETGQLDRAVSFHKGCYLGQEVVERMRSRGALARRFVRITAPADTSVKLPCDLIADEKVVGSLTSLAQIPGEDRMIGLATVRAAANAQTLEIAGSTQKVTIAELPGTAESA